MITYVKSKFSDCSTFVPNLHQIMQKSTCRYNNHLNSGKTSVSILHNVKFRSRSFFFIGRSVFSCYAVKQL